MGLPHQLDALFHTLICEWMTGVPFGTSREVRSGAVAQHRRCRVEHRRNQRHKRRRPDGQCPGVTARSYQNNGIYKYIIFIYIYTHIYTYKYIYGKCLGFARNRDHDRQRIICIVVIVIVILIIIIIFIIIIITIIIIIIKALLKIFNECKV